MTSAADLEAQLIEAQTLERQAEAQLDGLSSLRAQMLADDAADAELDAIEAESAALARRLERLEAKIPVLRARHAAQLEAERLAGRHRDFEGAIAARLAAADAVDAALDRLGAAYRLLRGTERRLQGVGMPIGSQGERDLLAAVLYAAPEFARETGMRSAVLLEARPLVHSERQRWARVCAAGGIDAVRPARAPADRGPALLPITSDELERSGRYGRTVVIAHEEGADALAA